MAHTYGEVLEASFGEVFSFLRSPNCAFVDVGSGYGSIVFAAAQRGCLSIEKYRDKFEAAQASLAQLPESIRRRTRFIEEDINDTDLGALLETILHEPASLQALSPAWKGLHPHDIPCDARDSSAVTGGADSAFAKAQQGTRAGSLSDESETSIERSDLQACSEAQGGAELMRLGSGCASSAQWLLSDRSDSGVSANTAFCGSSGGGGDGDCCRRSASGGRAFDSLLIFCNNVAFNQGTIHRSGAKFKEVIDRFERIGIPVTVISMMPLRELHSQRLTIIRLHTTWNDSELHETHVYV